MKDSRRRQLSPFVWITVVTVLLLLVSSSVVQAQCQIQKKACPLGLAANNVILAYPFDKDGGLRAIDVSGADFHGDIRGARFTSAGNRGAGLRFFGHKDAVKVSGVKLRQFTFAAWVQADTDDLDNRTLLLLQGGKRFCSVQGNSGGGIGVIVTGGKEVNEYEWTLSGGQWTHVAVTYDGYLVNIYRDGVLSETRSLRSYTPIIGDLYIGGGNPHNRSWQGVLDDVLVANRVFTGDEILKVYGKTLKPQPVKPCICACRPKCQTKVCCKSQLVCKPTPACKPKSCIKTYPVVQKTQPVVVKQSCTKTAPASVVIPTKSCTKTKAVQSKGCCTSKFSCIKKPPSKNIPIRSKDKVDDDCCKDKKPYQGRIVIGEISCPPVGPLKPTPNTESITIEAFIDGVSDLWLMSSGILWKNVTHTAKPGLGDGRNEPTWLAGYPWYPQWGYNAQVVGIGLSQVYPLPLRPGMYKAELLASGTARAASSIERGYIEAIPIKGSLVVRIVDPDAGPGWYRIRVTRLDEPTIW